MTKDAAGQLFTRQDGHDLLMGHPVGPLPQGADGLALHKLRGKGVDQAIYSALDGLRQNGGGSGWQNLADVSRDARLVDLHLRSLTRVSP